MIDELSESETEELRNAAPQLRALLTDSHPAREVPATCSASRASPTARRMRPLCVPRSTWPSNGGKAPTEIMTRTNIVTARGCEGVAEQALARADQLDAREFPAAGRSVPWWRAKPCAIWEMIA